jgi:pimeloyl-ACP methyl ester carboxylesterase
MIRIEDWLAGGAMLDWHGHRIYIRVVGRGDPVLLIHGFPTSSLDWRLLEHALADRFRLISFDMLGFGLSDKPVDGDYRIAAQADLAEAVLAHFGVRGCRVLAHDYGDTVAQELLARQIDGHCSWTLQRLCLLNGGLIPECHRPRLIQRLLASPIGPLIARLTRYPRFAAAMRQICRQPLDDAELLAMWSMIERNDGRRVMPKLIGYMAERRLHRERWVGALQRAPVPVRLVDGVDDPISGRHLVQGYRELVAGADVVELPGVGHYPQLEAPAAVASAFVDFAAGDGFSVPTAAPR